MQGSPPDEPCQDLDERQFTHTLTRSVLVMEIEVTCQMWADLRLLQPSLPVDPADLSAGSGMTHPVQNNTWYEAVFFANLLSIERGLTRCYYKDAEFTVPVDISNYLSGSFFCDFDANGYRLPTEGEWEHFTRAGTTSPFSIDEPLFFVLGNCSSCTGGLLPDLESVAVFCANDSSETAAAGSKNPNPYGLRDIHGNVWEWCWDWYAEVYPAGSAFDYAGATSGSYRAFRGGCWNSPARQCRSANRFRSDPGFRDGGLGFRLLRTNPCPLMPQPLPAPWQARVVFPQMRGPSNAVTGCTAKESAMAWTARGLGIMLRDTA